MRLRPLTRPLLLASLLSLAACGGSGGGADNAAGNYLNQYPAQVDPALAAKLATMAADEPIGVIVRLAGSLDSAAWASRSTDQAVKTARRNLLRALRDSGIGNRQRIIDYLSTLDIDKLRDLWVINGVGVELPAGEVGNVATMPGVEEIELDEGFEMPGSFNLPATATWGVATVRAPEVWNLGSRGEGVLVAIMDTGVDSLHPQLRDRYRGGGNSWFDPHGEYDEPYDSDGHGTQVAGLVVAGAIEGQGGSASQPIGVAPGAQWIAAKLFDSRGETTMAAIHATFQWLLDPDGDPDTDDAPQVVNNSWGLLSSVGGCNTEFAPDIAALRAAGMSVVFAAGNSGPFDASDVSPANDAGSLSVGAVRPDGLIEQSSSRGPNSCSGDFFPRLAAPGTAVTSTDLTYGGLLPHSYSEVTGTSFAAPHVAGAIALLRTAFPEATAVEIDSALERTAGDLAALGPDHDSGHGMIDVHAAYQYLATGATPGPGNLQFSATGFSADEDGARATVTVSRTGGSRGAVSVGYATADETATAGSDYAQTSGRLDFADGQTSTSFDIELFDDASYEGDETLSLTLSSPAGGAGLGSPTRATLTIVEDEPAIPGLASGAAAQFGPSADLQLGAAQSGYDPHSGRWLISLQSSAAAREPIAARVSYADGRSRSQPMRWDAASGRWQLQLAALDGDVPPRSVLCFGRGHALRIDLDFP